MIARLVELVEVLDSFCAVIKASDFRRRATDQNQLSDFLPVRQKISAANVLQAGFGKVDATAQG